MKEIFRELAGYWSQAYSDCLSIKKKEFFYSQEKLKN